MHIEYEYVSNRIHLQEFSNEISGLFPLGSPTCVDSPLQVVDLAMAGG